MLLSLLIETLFCAFFVRLSQGETQTHTKIFLVKSGQSIVNPQPELRPFPFVGFPYCSLPFGVTSVTTTSSAPMIFWPKEKMAPLLTVLHDLGVVGSCFWKPKKNEKSRKKCVFLKTTGETKKRNLSSSQSFCFFKKTVVEGNDVLRLISAGSEHFFPKNHCSKCASGLKRGSKLKIEKSKFTSKWPPDYPIFMASQPTPPPRNKGAIKGNQWVISNKMFFKQKLWSPSDSHCWWLQSSDHQLRLASHSLQGFSTIPGG